MNKFKKIVMYLYFTCQFEKGKAKRPTNPLYLQG